MRWLARCDITLSDEDGIRPCTDADAPLALYFPRCWPDCFKQSKALKRLIKQLGGERCRAVSLAAAELEWDVELRPLDSFGNAERAAASEDGWALLKGFAIYEQAADAAKAAEASSGTFVAVRHWWNAKANGTWIDLTPPLASSAGQVLLIESRQGEKAAVPLVPSEVAATARLLGGDMAAGDGGDEGSALFVVGDAVTIHGLFGRSDLNGSAARVLGLGADALRLNVRLLRTGEVIACKPRNLAPRDGEHDEIDLHASAADAGRMDDAARAERSARAEAAAEVEHVEQVEEDVEEIETPGVARDSEQAREAARASEEAQRAAGVPSFFRDMHGQPGRFEGLEDSSDDEAGAEEPRSAGCAACVAMH